MNRIFRIVWSATRSAFIVAHELASANGKPSSQGTPDTPGTGLPQLIFSVAPIALAVCLAVSPAPTFAAPPVNTLPTGGQIVGGASAGSIATSGNAMTVTQNQQRMIANWESFSIGSAASVHFQQPAGGVALNRVTGNQPSEIFGRLTSTGSVFLTNPNGVIFGRGAQVDVGSLVATTMKISDSNFMAGNYAFTGGNGSVINQGTLNAALGGYVALLAPEVRNEGVIAASLGQVVLGGAEAFTLSHDSSGLQYAVDKGAVQELVENKSLVQADGGQVLLSARAANALASAVINNSGTIEASVRSVEPSLTIMISYVRPIASKAALVRRTNSATHDSSLCIGVTTEIARVDSGTRSWCDRAFASITVPPSICRSSSASVQGQCRHIGRYQSFAEPHRRATQTYLDQSNP